MKLRYISLGLEYDYFVRTNNQLRYEFQLHTRFISNYLSKAIRKHSFEGDGFNMISVALLPNLKEPYSKIKAINVLETYLPFHKERYELIKGTEDCGYYLELFEKGFLEASKFRSIPLNNLSRIIEEFKVGGCLNEWTHKRKQFREDDLRIELKCEFTTNYFQLRILVDRLSSKIKVFNGVIIRTEPDEVLFEKMYKDIFVNQNEIIITDESDSPRIIIDKSKMLMGILEYRIIGNNEVKEMLTYGL